MLSKESVNGFKAHIILIQSIGIFTLLWILPFLFGKYTDISFPFIPDSEIENQLLFDKGNSIDKFCPLPGSQFSSVNSRILFANDIKALNEKILIDEFKIKQGGKFLPQKCQHRLKIALIIPFRNRTTHLQQFLSYMHPFLHTQNIAYQIFVIEQTSDKPFNRGKLFNIGFSEVNKEYKFDCFIFHDVDLLPIDLRNVYGCTTKPRHMYSAVDTFRYNLPYRNMLGGAVAISKAQFEIVNGFANRFYGWGAEDDDFNSRLENKGLTIVRFQPDIASYVMLSHKTDVPSPDRFHLLQVKADQEDGLRNLEYKIINKKENPLYTRFLVSC